MVKADKSQSIIGSRFGGLRNSKFSRPELLIFVLVFGLIGYFIFRSFAANPVLATLEAEQMSLPAGASVITDALASGGKAIQFTANGTAASNVSLSSQATSLTIMAYGSQCNGSPAMSAAVDGNSIMGATSISSTSWTGYSTTTNLASGTHSLSLAASNVGSSTKRHGHTSTICYRYLYVDVTIFYGPASPPPAPTVALSASPLNLTAGQSSTLTWSSANATACSASGAWSGSEPISGSTSTGALNQNTTYSLTCTGSGGSATASVTITVNSTTGSSSCPNLTLGQCLAYDSVSAWNTPIPTDPTIDPESATFINAIADNGVPLTSDPTQYTFPVWVTNSSTPMAKVTVVGYFSSYDSGDNSKYRWSQPIVVSLPVPSNAAASSGTDGQICFWDPVAGVEYGFYQWSGSASTGYTAQYGYRYHTTSSYYGRFADGGTSARGAGTPYLAGLVRKWEVDQGHIDHALTFGYNSPSSAFVYPASKSDGGEFGGVLGVDLPEGSLIQLNPALTDTDFNNYGLNASAKVIAKALQKYGMYVVDHAGSSKLYLEDSKTAAWGSDISRSMLSGIPWSQFRVVDYSGSTNL